MPIISNSTQESLSFQKNNWNNIDFNTTTIEYILPSRLIGPPKDWAYAQWFIQGNEESIYGKLYKNNMEGLSSFYPVLEGIDYLVNSDTEVALFQFMNLHSFQEYQCKVKTLKKYIVKILLWVHNGHPIFLKMYHFIFHFMSSLVTWDVVILVLIILKTHVWLRDF